MPVTRVGEPFRVASGVDKHGWKYTRNHAVYECSCGTRFVMQCRSEKGTQSCGCFARESARNVLTGNTYRRTSAYYNRGTYTSWLCMRGRCNATSHIEFHRYGARGISVCPEWDSFDKFLEDMGPRPEGMSIERKDNSVGYCKDNCRWATPTEQARNKRNNVLLTIDGVTKTAVEWSEHPEAASDKTIYKRVSLGWSDKDAVFGRES